MTTNQAQDLPHREVVTAINGQLLSSLARLAQLQREPLDQLAVTQAVKTHGIEANTPQETLKQIMLDLHLPAVKWVKKPDPAVLPLLMHDPVLGWRVLANFNAKNEWISQVWDKSKNQWIEEPIVFHDQQCYARLTLRQPYRATDSEVGKMILNEILARKNLLLEATVGGLVLSIIAMATSFYSMQIYDRVIPVAGYQTLAALTLGMLIAIGFEYVARRVRSRIYEKLIDEVDSQLSRAVYMRFLSLRMDQVPQRVGALAGQLKGYETVRSFLVQLVTQFLVDLPFALIFVLVIVYFAGVIAVIPFALLLVSLLIGFKSKKNMQKLMQQSNELANQKTGLLVETIEGAETIKSGHGAWRMLSRWLTTSHQSRDIELQGRRDSEGIQHMAQAVQQLAYVLIVALGAILVVNGSLSFGGLIACSILSGRILGPIAQIGTQLMAWGQAKAALQGLDAIWKLEGDNHGVDTPVTPEVIRGNFRSEGARFILQNKCVLDLPEFQIKAGERIGILGPVGAGKTTLLRLLTGMYKPQQGRILLDDTDMQYIAKPNLSEKIGYLQQDGRLFSGTLRENLILGLPDPGDDAIMAAARASGLLSSVITPHPRGLEQPIQEGGTGLSGGQKQLVHITRTLLRKPSIWLLDEPTATLDRQTELAVIAALHAAVMPTDTLVLVTHKFEMLQLVQRVVVVAGGRIVLDGPRDEVLRQLQAGPAAAAPARPTHGVQA